MSARFVTVDRHTPMLMPPDLQDWLPQNDLARFVVDTLEMLPIRQAHINHRGTGSRQYPPRTMLALLVYCYACGVRSSRRIEIATYRDIAARFICGGDNHPDHDTICTFRRENKDLLEEVFVKILLMAEEAGLAKVGRIALDGTKVHANASKHKAVSYKRAGEKIEELEKEVRELLEAAEKADTDQDDDGMSIPDELKIREERIKKLRAARERMEARLREQQQGTQGSPGGTAGKDKPDDKTQHNFTDSDSRIMKAGNGKHFEQSYNAQCAVDTDGSMLIVGKHVTNECNDKHQLVAGVDSVPEELGEVDQVAVDNGYHCKEEIETLEKSRPDKETGPKVYVALKKQRHGKSLKDVRADLCRPDEEDERAVGDAVDQVIRKRMQSRQGHDFYRLRKQTVEPVFGIIKQAMGFRQFLLRGLEKVNTEWALVTLAYNFRRLYVLGLPLGVNRAVRG